MTEEPREIMQRLDWLERKIIRTIWALSSIIGAICGWVIASAVTDFFGVPNYGAVWALVCITSWIGLGIAAARSELKDAPGRAKFLEP